MAEYGQTDDIILEGRKGRRCKFQLIAGSLLEFPIELTSALWG